MLSSILEHYRPLKRNLKNMINAKKISSFFHNKKKDNGFHFSNQGHCHCCDSDVVFSANCMWLRDHYKCTNCNSIPRERALMFVIEKYYPQWKNLKIHESSPGGRGASLKLQKNCKDYLGTQYYPNHKRGEHVRNYRNEDLEKQTFEDESFDLVITQDVMEHIYNPEKAFFEIARTLKKGGAHIFTVPIINRHKNTEVWAKKGENGEPVFLKTPEWHGNPVDSKGSPVTMHWGFDIVDFIEKTSGLETTIEYIFNLSLGIWAEYIEVLVSKKR